MDFLELKKQWNENCNSINKRCDQAEDRICETENRNTESIYSKKNKEK